MLFRSRHISQVLLRVDRFQEFKVSFGSRDTAVDEARIRKHTDIAEDLAKMFTEGASLFFLGYCLGDLCLEDERIGVESEVLLRHLQSHFDMLGALDPAPRCAPSIDGSPEVVHVLDIVSHQDHGVAASHAGVEDIMHVRKQLCETEFRLENSGIIFISGKL